MYSLEYGKMPTLFEFINHLKLYSDLDGLVAGEPPEVFVMEVHPSCDNYEAFFELYNSLNSEIQNDIDIVISPIEEEWIKVTFTTYESFYKFLLSAIDASEFSMEIATMILETIGFVWE